MKEIQNLRRFRINPVEIFIFSIITFLFAHSLYRLLYHQDEFNPTSLTPMSSSPISEDRKPSSVPVSLATLEIDCEGKQLTTQASKIRLIGQLCGLNPTKKDITIKTAKVTHTNTASEATLFSDIPNEKFSTDYIALNPSDNKIHLEFSYSDGTQFAKDIIISRRLTPPLE